VFEALNDSAFRAWLVNWLWAFPSAEIFHIVMTGGFFGGIAMLDLRLLGFHRRIPVSVLMQHILPCLWWLFIGVVVSGALLFVFMPMEYPNNPAFLTKMVLIPVGGLNALFMHIVLLRHQHLWDAHGHVPAGVRISAFISLLIWMGCLACGRLIAYYYGF
jgi:hypothetical protein